MLKTTLIHPQMLEALGRAGHGSRILITDGNYPAGTTLGPNATHVSLNLSPGVISCTQALEAILSVTPIEAAHVMDYASTGPYGLDADPPIWDEFRSLLGPHAPQVELEAIERFEFYETAAGPEVALVVQTADQRIYANLLLTIGVVMPG